MGPTGFVYLEKLTEFSALLRQEGLTVGPQETADACRVLEAFGFSDREVVKAALRAVYAKSQQEQGAFDRAFDGFFVSVERREALRGVLAQDPRPRYQEDPERVYGFGFAGREVRFTVSGGVVHVVEVL